MDDWGANIMPTNLQIIDGIEGLRAEFLRENPGHFDAGRLRSGPDFEDTAAHVISAWIQTREGRAPGDGESLRRLRELTRAILAAEPVEVKETNEIMGVRERPRDRDAELVQHGREAAARLDRAARARLWPM